MKYLKKSLSRSNAPVRIYECDTHVPLYRIEGPRIDLVEIGRALWKRLFLQVFTEEDLALWEADIPNYDCKCKDFYLDWKLTNPVEFPINMDWKYRLKSAVNAKLGHPNITFEEAVRVWSV